MGEDTAGAKPLGVMSLVPLGVGSLPGDSLEVRSLLGDPNLVSIAVIIESFLRILSICDEGAFTFLVGITTEIMMAWKRLWKI